MIYGKYVMNGQIDLNKTIEEAMGDYHEMRKNNPDTDLEEFLNTLVYEFLLDEDYDKALAVFKLNVDENPESWNVYDSLTEGYERSGDIRNAVKYYERSLEINSGNSHGKERLKNLRSRYMTV
jgi:tetratricopeptide (TPR) repeat protein